MNMCACMTSNQTDTKTDEKNFFEKMASMMCGKMFGDEADMKQMMENMSCCDESSSCCGTSNEAEKTEEPQTV